MRALSLYEEKNTAIHKLGPVTKVLYAILSITVPFILPSRFIALAWILFSLILLCVGKVTNKVIPFISFSFIALISVVIIQGLFKAGNATVLFHLGPLRFYKEGLYYALGICLRVLNILFSFTVFILTTKPSDLIEALMKKGLSPRIGYVMNSVFQVIPEMLGTISKITNAQSARGMETEGNIIVRLKAFLPLLGPAVMNSLTNTRERSMALEVRAFNSKEKKTFLNERESWVVDKYIRILMLIVLAAAVFWRLTLWKK